MRIYEEYLGYYPRFLTEVDYAREPRLRVIAPYLHIWTDHFRPLPDCPPELRAEVEAYCAMRSERSNRSRLRAYRAGLLP